MDGVAWKRQTDYLKENRDRGTDNKVLGHLHGAEMSDRRSDWWRTGPARGYRERRKDDNGLTGGWDGRGFRGRGTRWGRCWEKKAKKERESRRSRRVEEEEEQREERKVYSLGQAVKTRAECITLMPWTGVTLSRDGAVRWKRKESGDKDRDGEEGEGRDGGARVDKGGRQEARMEGTKEGRKGRRKEASLWTLPTWPAYRGSGMVVEDLEACQNWWTIFSAMSLWENHTGKQYTFFLLLPSKLY